MLTLWYYGYSVHAYKARFSYYYGDELNTRFKTILCSFTFGLLTQILNF
jgi:hypothetical protein